MKKNTNERTMAVRFIQIGLILMAILCMACGNVKPHELHNFNHAVNNAIQLRHYEMHQNGHPHSHGNCGWPHHH